MGTCLHFSQDDCDDVVRKDPRFVELPTKSSHGALHPRYYGLVRNFSRSPPEHYQGGTRGGVLLSLRVWRGRHWLSTRD